MGADAAAGLADAAGAGSTCAESESAVAEERERRREEKIFMEQDLEEWREAPNARGQAATRRKPDKSAVRIGRAQETPWAASFFSCNTSPLSYVK
jgi:hypothetical protein